MTARRSAWLAEFTGLRTQDGVQCAVVRTAEGTRALRVAVKSEDAARLAAALRRPLGEIALNGADLHAAFASGARVASVGIVRGSNGAPEFAATFVRRHKQFTVRCAAVEALLLVVEYDDDPMFGFYAFASAFEDVAATRENGCLISTC